METTPTSQQLIRVYAAVFDMECAAYSNSDRVEQFKLQLHNALNYAIYAGWDWFVLECEILEAKIAAAMEMGKPEEESMFRQLLDDHLNSPDID